MWCVWLVLLCLLIVPITQVVSQGCENLSNPPNGTVNQDETPATVNSKARYTCADGYYVAGGTNINICQANGEWSHNLTCALRECLELARSAGTTFSTTGVSLNTIVTAQCDEGYEYASGDYVLSCEKAIVDDASPKAAAWNGTQFVCSIKDCNTPPTPDNGSVSAPVTTFGSKANYTCNVGYTISNTTDRTCQSDGSWSNPEPNCTIQDCGPKPNVTNGTLISGEATTYRSTLQYKCDIGFEADNVVNLRVICEEGGDWSTPPTCNPITCGNLSNITNGVVSIGGYNFGDVATYSCDDASGYKHATGDLIHTCTETGDWNGTEPTCIIRDCGPLSPPTNGDVDTSYGSKVGRDASFTCISGYDIVGDGTATCQTNGTWSSTVPECIIKDCGPKPNVTGGTLISGNATTYRSALQYQCDIGFEADNDTNLNVTCDENGDWSTAPTCIIITCGKVPSIKNGNVSQEGSNYGDVVTYMCDDAAGYEMSSGDSTRTCIETKSWNGTQPTCSLRDCKSLPNPTNGLTDTSNGTEVGDVATFNCTTGYYMVGNGSANCETSGNWSSSVPECFIQDCSRFENLTLEFGNVTADNTTYNEIAEFSCNIGYQLNGTSNRTCLADGSWTGEPPSCEIITCGKAPSIKNGNVSQEGSNYGDVVTYMCDDAAGYEMSSGDSTRTCIETKSWNGTQPTCSLRDCKSLSNPTNGLTDTSNGTEVGDVATFNCTTGYYMVGNGSANCETSGNWSSSVPECFIQDCSRFENLTLEFGNVTADNTTYNEIAEFSCNIGYQLNGTSNRTCLADGSWTGEPPSCEIITCGKVPTIKNGNVSQEGSNYGDVVTYMCDDASGYEMSSGDSTRTCIETKSWNGTQPTCSLRDCKSLSNPTNGLTDTSNGTEVGDVATFNCTTGYYMVGNGSANCETSGNWSSSVPECFIQDCSRFENLTLEFGNVTADNTTYNETAEFSCNIGYQLNGTSNRTCLADGSWTGEPPSCEIINCGILTPIDNGNVTHDDTVYDSVANYTCDDRYYISAGDKNRTCDLTKDWSGTEPTCSLYECGYIAMTIENGSANKSGNTTGDVVNYLCDHGYYISPGVTSKSIECILLMGWNDTAVNCTLVDCGELSAPLNGQVNIDLGTTLGNQSAYTCNEGYNLVNGSNVRTCQAYGFWDLQEPTCEIVNCLAPPSVPYVTINVTNGTTYGQWAYYSCDVGHELVSGDSARTCQANGSWSLEEMQCTPENCGDLSSNLTDGSVSGGNGTLYPNSTTYTCNEGFFIRPGLVSLVITCNSSGIWDNDVPTCQPVDCGNIPDLYGGEIFYNNTGYNTIASITCDPRATFVGDCNTRTCEADGNWTNCLYSCNIPDCGNLTYTGNGNVSFTRTEAGDAATYTCNYGYYISSGNETRICQNDTSWSGDEPNCTIIDCATTFPASITNGTVNYTDTTFRSVVTFTCYEDNYFQGSYSSSSQLTCHENGTWMGPTPVDCRLLACDTQPEFDNTSVPFYLGSMANFTCDIGYKLSNDSDETFIIFKCIPDLNGSVTWNESAECIIQDCGPPDRVPHGTIDVNSTVYNSTYVVTCNEGFNITSGDEIRTCDPLGNWTGMQPVCERVDCQAVNTSLPYGSVKENGTLFQDIARYICEEGYHIVGNRSLSLADITCTKTAVWNYPPLCTPIDCGRLDAPDNGSVDDVNHVYQDIATYRCNMGYFIDGDQNQTCKADGSWSDTPPVCTIYTCPALTNPQQGSVIVTKPEYLNVASYRCDTGYKITAGSVERTCQDGGQWSGTQPTCTIKDCGTLNQDLDNGFMLATGSEYEDTALYSCNSTYYIQGTTDTNLTLTCTKHGNWSNTTPTCVQIDCGGLPNISNGVIEYKPNTLYESTATYSCNHGYNMTAGDSAHTCQSSSSWDGDVPTCTIFDCGVPVNVSHAKITWLSTVFNNSYVVTCDEGFYISLGDSKRTCQHGGSWDGTQPVCGRVNCASLSTSLLYGSVVQNGTVFEDIFNYTCDPGYHITGDRTLHTVTLECLSTGNWSDSPPTCSHVDCGQLTYPGNGTLETPGNSLYNSVANFSCHHGYELLGNGTLTCQEDGSWYSDPPTCRVYDCHALPYGGLGNVSYNSTVFGSTAHYTCNRGHYISAGDSDRTCLHGGSWGGVEPTCTIYDCGPINQTIRNGYRSQTGSTYLKTVTYTCVQDHYVAGTVLSEWTVTCGDDGTWDREPPNCVIIDCGSLSHPSHVRFNNSGSTIYGHNVTYNCETGYNLTGSQFRECGGDGNWTGTPAVCTIYDCLTLADPSHGSVDLSQGTLYEAVATFKCEYGYHLEAGNQYRVCQDGGMWNGTTPVCIIADCKALMNPVNGHVNHSLGTTFNQTAEFFCKHGYRLEGKQQVTCQANQSWNGEPPECVFIDCGPLTHPANGSVSSVNGTYGEVATYKCNEGYMINGDLTRTCQYNSTWTGSMPYCTIYTCPPLTTPQHGSVIVTKREYLNVASYRCDTGYKITAGSVERTCQDGGQWSGARPTCSRKDCGTLSPIVAFGNMISNGSKYEDTAEYICNNDYYIHVADSVVSSLQLTCTQNGTWSDSVPSCVKIDCSQPSAVDNGNIVGSIVSSLYGSNVTYTCNHGYNMTSGNETITCGKDSSWEGELPNCTIYDCGVPEVSPHGNMHFLSSLFGDSYVVTCNRGFELTSGDSIRTCQDGGHWNGSRAVCSRVDCASLSTSLLYGSVVQNGTVFEDNFNYTCDPGYHITGDRTLHTVTLKCLSTGNWSGSPPTCSPVDCGQLTSPDNGTLETPGNSLYSSVANFSCHHGYELLGNRTLTCQEDGHWSSRPPTCRIYDCHTLPYGGLGNVSFNSTVFGSNAHYTCNRGHYISAGDSDKTCLHGGSWGGVEPTCTIYDCGFINQSLENGLTSQTGSKYMDTIKYTCFPDHYISGTVDSELTLTCEERGNWTGSPPTCVIIDCGPLSHPAHGHYNSSGSTIYGHNVTYTCDTGYKLTGSQFRHCAGNGNWTGTPAVCTIYVCLDLPVIAHGNIDYDGGKEYGASASYLCDLGYDLEPGDAKRVCQHGGLWNGTQPMCRLVDCYGLHNPVNGLVDMSNGTTFNMTAEFHCKHDYRLEGDQFLTCQADGLWNGNMPSCQLIDCGSLVPPANGSVDGMKRKFGEVGTYKCNEGYMINGDLTRTCQYNSTWTGSMPSCTIYTCPALTNPQQGSVIVTKREYLNVASYRCDTGYKITAGSVERTCQDGGQWSGTQPTCTIKDCGHLNDSMPHGNVLITGSKYHHIVSYICDHDYYIEGSLDTTLNLTCTEHGNWSNTPPTCVQIDCAVPKTVAHGDVQYNRTLYGSVAYYSCDRGYNMTSGDTQHNCGEDKLWNGTLPTCTIYDCGEPPAVPHGNNLYLLTTYLQRYLVMCDEGFMLMSGNRGRTCEHGGNWTGTQPVCGRIDCASLSTSLLYGSVVQNGTVFEDIFNYTCDPGYHITGDRTLHTVTLQCLSTGNWSGSPPTCSPVECRQLSSPDNGTLETPGNSLYSSVANFSCHHGYELLGNSTLTCQEDGRWSSRPPTCRIYDCHTLPYGGLGNVSYNSTVFGSTAHYTCNRGHYISVGDSDRTCLHGGSWGGVEPTCTIYDCGPINQTIRNGYRSQTGSTYLKTVTYTCVQDHYVAGTVLSEWTVTCGDDGNWTNQPERHVCLVIDCGPLSHPAHGHYNSSGSTIYGHNVTYTCDTGYELTGSQFRQCAGDGNWTGIPATCTIQNCDSLPDPDHGHIELVQGAIYQATAVSHCDTGYRLSAGDRTRVCQQDGKWNGTRPICKIVDCLPVLAPVNGDVDTSNGTTFNKTSMYTCHTGYKMHGDYKRVCQESGNWDGGQPSCHRIDCRNLVNPEHGFVVTSYQNLFESVAHYDCDHGYRLVGNDSSVCQYSEDWSGSPPYCQIKNCGSLNHPLHGVVSTPNGTVYNATAIYTCEDGYQLTDGPTTRLCIAAETWTGTQPNCTIKSCGPISAPTNGSIMRTDNTYGSQATFTCNLGYSLYGSDTSYCQADGTWSSFTPSCILTECRGLSNPENGRVDFTNNQFGHTVTYHCNAGFIMQGTSSRICGVTGSWSGAKPTCQPQYCSSLEAPENGFVDVEGRGYQALARYRCKTGYRLTGFQQTRCAATGAWDPATTPACTIKKCGSLSSPVNGFITINTGITYGSHVNFSCLPGYYLSSNISLYCTESGGWSDDIPTCILYDCDSLEKPVHGNVMMRTGTRVDSEALFTCEEGYRISGSQKLTCRQDGHWNGVPPTCHIKDCGPPAEIPNGNTYQVLSTTFNSTVEYRCDLGYMMASYVTVRRCLDTGLWSMQIPQCVKKDCHTPPELVHGHFELSNGTTYTSTAQYHCDAGYQINGTDTRLCQSTGFWSNQTITCTIKHCPELTFPIHGNMSMSSTMVTGVARFSCDEGYQMFGSDIVQCHEDGTWTSLAPSCNITDCKGLVDPEHGSVTFLETTYGQEAIYQCYPGYRLNGLKDPLCQLNGNWSGTPPTCQPVSCPQLFPPVHGHVDTSAGFLYPARVFYHCEEGYQLKGATYKDCSETGAWFPVTDPTCDIITCQVLYPPVNGSLTLTSGLDYGSDANYQCHPGFDLSSDGLLHCNADGNWNSTPPVCNIRVCPRPAEPQHGSVEILNGVVYGAMVMYNCDTGYRLDGAQQVWCLANRTWSQSAPTCVLQDCGNLPFPQNGYINETEGHGLGAKVYYYCNPGYRIQGISPRVCQATEEWSNEEPICVRSECGDAPTVPFALMNYPNGQGLGNYVKYTCIPGYQLEGGASSLLCGQDGQWSGEVPVCTVKDCGGLAQINNGFANVPQFTIYKARATYTCNSGYTLVGNNTVECEMSGRWTQEPSCAPVSCGSLLDPDHGLVRMFGGSTYGQTAVYTCDSGYLLNGTALRLCTEASQWSGGKPVCEVNVCPELSNPLNGVVLLTGYHPGNTATYFCDDGYVVLGTANRFCQLDGTWTDFAPTCVLQVCPELTAPVNGQLQLSNSRSYRSIATYACDRLYDIGNGDEMRICQSDRTWSGSKPLCILKSNVVTGNLTLRQNLTMPDGVDLSDPAVYESYRQSVYNSLMEHYRSQGLTDILINILSLLKGSLLITFEVVVPTTKEMHTVGDLTTSLLRKNVPLLINGTATETLNVIVGQLNDCFGLSDPENGQVTTPNGTKYGSLAIYSCILGYAIQGTMNRTCTSDGTWQPERPLCSIVDCGQPPALENGRVTLNPNSTYLSVARYECDTGFTLLGPASSQCISSGSWSPNPPVCQPIACTALVNPEHGTVILSANGLTASFTCDLGYTLSQNPGYTRQCSQAGWSGTSPQCNIIDCGVPGSLVDGNIQMSGTTYGITAFYSCNDGFNLVGSSQAICGLNGNWSQPLPMCRVIACGDVPSPSNGLVTVSSDGLQASYSCNSGYVLSDSRMRSCDPVSNTWNEAPPTCNLIDCGAPPSIQHGQYGLTNGTRLGSLATYSCTTPGYLLTTGSSLTCTASTQWTGEIPVCRLKDCGTLASLTNGKTNYPGGTVYGQQADFTCDEGYSLDGPAFVSCQLSGWSSSPPTCVPLPCPALANPEHGTVTLSANGLTASFTCDLGYTLSQNPGYTRQCSQAGWSGTSPQCNIIDCGDPGPLVDGNIQMSGTTYGITAFYSCNGNLNLVGSSQAICGLNGNWSQALPMCRVIACGDVPSPSNGLVTVSSDGLQASYSCNSGYVLSDSRMRSCDPVSNTWNEAPPTCNVIDCGAPPSIQHGQYGLTNGTRLGSLATYSCTTPGYLLTTGSSLTCTVSTQWTGEIPVCRVKDCGTLASLTNGRTNYPGGTVYGQQADFTCDEGYSLDGPAFVSCQLSGWSSSPPTCVPLPCPALANPEHGTVILSANGLTASFTCDLGYTLSQNPGYTRQCSQAGWSGTSPQCNIIDCGDPGPLVDGNIQMSGTTYGITAFYSCNGNLNLVGSSQAICGLNGDWSQPLPMCKVIACGDVPSPSNGLVTVSSDGLQASYSCNSGYVLSDSHMRSCDPVSNTWNEAPPTCNLIDCGAPPSIQHGQYGLTNGTRLGSLATYSCTTPGYLLTTGSSLTCTASTQWTGDIPVCRLKDCGTLASLTNGRTNYPGGTVYGQQADFTCDEGYSLDGPAFVSCQLSGWSSSTSTCVPLHTCDPLTNPPNGSVAVSEQIIGSLATYSCDTGYQMSSGSLTRLCEASGQWSGTQPVCTIKNCSGLIPPENGQVSGLTTYLETATYTCNQGYVLSGGDATRFCTAEGRWTGSVPVCTQSECLSLTPLANGSISLSFNHSMGTVATYTCDEGYIMTGAPTRVCDTSLSWTGTAPVCSLVQCSTGVMVPLHGSVEQTGPIHYKETVRYTCEIGYSLSGPAVLTCQSNGQFDELEPVCRTTDCGPLKSPTNGRASIVNGTTYLARAFYTCDGVYEVKGSIVRICEADGIWSSGTPQCVISGDNSLAVGLGVGISGFVLLILLVTLMIVHFYHRHKVRRQALKKSPPINTPTTFTGTLLPVKMTPTTSSYYVPYYSTSGGEFTAYSQYDKSPVVLDDQPLIVTTLPYDGSYPYQSHFSEI